ncbi:ABC transporter substrate-binding protein [Brevibacterium litoralis]|uniref:ABC transporter substrate-binding protein n=1 Tax=Brevibacterium litoralis TaxID=3138935 RepID=UPI0032F03BF3
MKKTLPVIGALGASALLLTGCMSGGGSTAEVDASVFENPVAGEVPADSLDGTTMTFVSYGGEFQTGQMTAFADPFSEITGATVLEDGPTDMAKLQAQVESGNVTWDVLDATPAKVEAYCGEIFEPLDMDRIDTSKIPEGVGSGECWVPSLTYMYGLYYNADVYGDNPPTGWEDFFDTENFPGTRAIDGRNTPTPGTLEGALMGDGVAPEDLYPLDTDRALEKYRSIEDDLVYWTSGAEQTQMLQGGEADLIFGWAGNIFDANNGGTNYKPVYEQAIVAPDTFSITKGSPNTEAAYAYINFALGAEQQAQMTELTGYSNVNVDAKPELDEMGNEFDISQHMDGTVPQNAVYWAENLDELTEVWTGYLNS